MGWRFQKVLSIIPGLRLNLSKSGVSTSVGPRGAGINVGRHGVTTHAGIPGTGHSYRQKMGKHGSWMGVVTVIAGLGLWAFNHESKVEHWLNGHDVTQSTVASTSHAPRVTLTSSAASAVVAAATPATGTRYVRRNNSDLRAVPSTSAPAIAKEARGTAVTLIAVNGKWSEVRAGAATGWMRSSVLGEEAP
jgi:hypothetical protein